MSDFLLKPKEIKFDLYNEGFKDVCRLERSGEGEKLSNLVERIEEPMVVAVDASWGAGKTTFLKCWVGAHELENGGTAKTVFFDAFRDDFMDDPLVGLISAISDRFDPEDQQTKLISKAKEAVSKFARPALRMGLAAATSSVSELAGPVVAAGLETGSKELAEASKTFWKRETNKRKAMESFREALENLASDQKLVIVVDELDRCRPDYALNLLEVIKHFFDVKNVHFVLGVNLKELANCVRARYGAEVQAERYLQKFITVRMPLIPPKARSASSQMQRRHFNQVAVDIGLTDSWKQRMIEEYLRFINHHAELSLRDVERIATLAMVTPDPIGNTKTELHLYTGALVLQILAPRTLEKARQGQMTAKDLFSIFKLENRNEALGADKEAHEIWSLVVWERVNSMPRYLQEAENEFFKDYVPRALLSEVIANTLDVFEVTG